MLKHPDLDEKEVQCLPMLSLFVQKYKQHPSKGCSNRYIKKIWYFNFSFYAWTSYNVKKNV